jgi:hypothetical protein
MRDRNDAAAADQSHRRFQPRQPIRGCRTHDRPIRLRTHSGNAEIRGYPRSRARARATRIAIESIRIARKPAAAAPSAGGMAGANVSPFAQVGLAQDHRAGFAQLRGNEGIVRRLRSLS